MRWWLGLTFAAVAGFTALGVVAVLGARTESAFKQHAREFAVGNALAASETLKVYADPDDLRREVASISARRAWRSSSSTRTGDC